MSDKLRDEADRLRDGELPSDPAVGTERVRMAPRGRAAVTTEIASERALLGALLWAGANAPETLRIEAVFDLLAGGEAMAEAAHRDIVAAMMACHEANAEHDPVAVHAQLVRTGRDRATGGLGGLRGLVDEASTVSEGQARVYAHAIREAWVRRLIEAAARTMAVEARDPRIRASEVVAKTFDGIARVAERLADSGTTIAMKDAMRLYFDDLQRGQKPRLSTGLRDLDELIVGLFPKEVTILAARTSVGKSALAAGMCLGAVERDPKAAVLYVSLEMHAELFCGRLAASRAGIPAKRLRRQQLSPTQWTDLMRAVGELAPLGIYFADSTTQTIQSIIAMAEENARARAAEGRKLAMVVIDHVGLVKPSAEALKRASREQQVAETSRGLRFIAEKFGCHVMALAQINREAEGPRGTRVPQVRHLAESDALGRDADNVLILHRDRDETTGLLDTDKPAALVVAKVRSDEPAPLLLTFDAPHVRFLNHDGEQTFQSVYGKPRC